MKWNWQRPDWPKFSWDAARLRKVEEHFLLQSGVVTGIFKHLGAEDRDQLTVDAISTEALTTSEIEGEILDRASVQSSIRKQFGLESDNRKVKPAEQGIAEMMVDLYRSFAEPLSEERLLAWHRTLMKGRLDLKDIGKYRSGHEPMQVISGALYDPRVHFEAPPSSTVPKEMARFVKWFNRSGPAGAEPLPALTRAGIAHLYFESIHPFEDGNGRIGRAISEKSVAQSLGHPTLTALAATILIRRKAYYRELEAANKHSEIGPWLAWFAGIAAVAGLITGVVGFRFGVSRRRGGGRALVAAGLILGGVAGAFAMLWLGQQIGLSGYNQHLASSPNGTLFAASLALGAKSALAFWPLLTAIVLLI